LNVNRPCFIIDEIDWEILLSYFILFLTVLMTWNRLAGNSELIIFCPGNVLPGLIELTGRERNWKNSARR